jgi:hemerythrin
MKKIVWKDEFSVGVERLDQQHRIFFRSKNVSSALVDLTNYVSEHFLLEERLLQENGYPTLLEHSKKHTLYSERVAEFCKESLDGKSEVPDELIAFLADWWTSHILHEDMQYKAFFDEKGVK